MADAASRLGKSALARRHLVFVGGTSEPGGLHIHTADIAQSCADLGYRVTILCPSINFYQPLLADGAVTVETIPSLDNMDWRAWMRTWSRLAAGGRLTIVFCCGHQAQIRIADLAAAALRSAAVYTIVHRPFEGDWRLRVSKATYGRITSVLLSGLIAVSEEIAGQAARDFHVPARKIATCLNWVAPVFRLPTTAERAEARGALGIAPSSLVIGYLGRLAPEKRVDVLLRAFAETAGHTDVPVALALFGDGWKKTELTELARSLNIDDRVRFCGWSAAPWSTLAACDGFVLPSLVEGFPLALIEAMAMGRACLAHPMPSAVRLIDNGIHGVLADLSDWRSFAAALRGLIECGEAVRSKMGLAAAGRIASEYSRTERLPKVLSALGLAGEAAPAFRLRKLEFRVNPA